MDKWYHMMLARRIRAKGDTFYNCDWEGAKHEWADMEDEELLRTSRLIMTDKIGKDMR